VNTFIPLEKLETLEKDELKNCYEIWITTSEAWPQEPDRTQCKCLWRSDRELTTDVKIDEAYFQNLPKVWVVVDSLDDSYVSKTEQALGKHFDELQVKGKFHPLDKPKVCSDDKNTDLRS